jgi:acetamidase/formamidase
MTLYTVDQEVFYPTFGKHTPVCALSSGDSVEIRLLDAHGYDGHGKRFTTFSNPLCGPFFINELESGDTVSVQIDDMQPIGNKGWSYTTPAATVVEPDLFAAMPLSKLIHWELDMGAETASPVDPPDSLLELKIPIVPMIGCLGVAPDKSQNISSYISGKYGGNMDCPLITTGCRIELPVFVDGGLLFIGDMHAAQSHGEITRAAIEIPGRVRFKVNALKGKTIGWPRGENQNVIFTIGCGRPLDLALQHAVSEMVRLLTGEFGLTYENSGILMSHCVKFLVSNMVNDMFSIACIIEKRFLPAK